DADAVGRDLHLHANPRRRRRGVPAGGGRGGDRAVGADCVGVVRAARRQALPRRLTMLAVDVEKRLGEFEIAAKFEASGGATALFGPSGAGKTSIVNMIAGRLAPDRGRIALDDTVLFDSQARIDVPAHRRRIGYVFQEGRLFPHLTAAQNLDYGRWMGGLPRDDADMERIIRLLDIA